MNERQLRALLITPDVAEFLISLHEKFENIRYHLLMKRRARWRECAEGVRLDFLPETLSVRNSEWHVFMADLEDALSPTWKNVLQGHLSLNQAVRRHLKFVSEDNKTYSLNEDIATLIVRPRGLHLEENNFQIRGHSISASLFDFGLYFFHNAQELIRRGSGPYFYLPKLETHEESSWWNEVFIYAQEYFHIPQGTIRIVFFWKIGRIWIKPSKF